VRGVVAGAWWACVMRVWRVRGLVAGAWWACVMQGDALACAWFGGWCLVGLCDAR